MNFEQVRTAAREEHLYPALILYGTNLDARQEAAVDLARIVLCERPANSRPCGDQPRGDQDLCHHCERIGWPPKLFHPDFHVLERDLRTATSTGATKSFLSNAYSAPFEARGQVFVIAEAESLSGGAADSLLKLLEEPPQQSPRWFMLLAASRLDLLTTLRSRSLSVYLGPTDALDEEEIRSLSEAFGQAIEGFFTNPSAIHLLTAADALSQTKGWKDPRNRKPWSTAAAAIAHYLEHTELDTSIRRALLATAEDLLDAPRMRVRGITHGRILEGLLARHLTRSTA